MQIGDTTARNQSKRKPIIIIATPSPPRPPKTLGTAASKAPPGPLGGLFLFGPQPLDRHPWVGAGEGLFQSHYLIHDLGNLCCLHPVVVEDPLVVASGECAMRRSGAMGRGWGVHHKVGDAKARDGVWGGAWRACEGYGCDESGWCTRFGRQCSINAATGERESEERERGEEGVERRREDEMEGKGEVLQRGRARECGEHLEERAEAVGSSWLVRTVNVWKKVRCGASKPKAERLSHGGSLLYNMATNGQTPRFRLKPQNPLIQSASNPRRP